MSVLEEESESELPSCRESDTIITLLYILLSFALIRSETGYNLHITPFKELTAAAENADVCVHELILKLHAFRAQN